MERVVLPRLTAVRRHGPAKHGLMVSGRDWRRRGVELGELLGEREIASRAAVIEAVRDLYVLYQEEGAGGVCQLTMAQTARADGRDRVLQSTECRMLACECAQS